jgi:hypothetical protein
MPSYSGELQPTKKFNAYIHARPDGTPFYVGKGNRSRVHRLSKRNPHHTNIVAKYGRQNILIGSLECSTETIAFELEIGMIKCLRRMGVELTNRTNGGEGCTGLVVSPEARARISTFLTGRKGTPWSDEQRAKFKAATVGRKRTPEQRARIGDGHRGKVVSDETREKLKAAAYVFWAKRKQKLGERDALV